MRKLPIFTALLLCALTTISTAQDNRVFDWTPANSETIPLEPASLHAGRIYHPAAGGGNMHVNIESRYPVTVAMTWADQWNASMQHPDFPVDFQFLCEKEHVTSVTYECHLPSERPMIITFRDERQPQKPVVTTIGAIIGPGARPFFSPTICTSSTSAGLASTIACCRNSAGAASSTKNTRSLPCPRSTA